MRKGDSFIPSLYPAGQPPATARMISTLSPSLSRCAPKAARRTTDSLTATAMPRAGSTPSSRSSVATVVPGASSRRCAVDPCVHALSFACGHPRFLALRRKGGEIRAAAPFENIGDGAGGGRREQDAVAVMPGRHDVARQRGSPDVRQCHRACRAAVRPTFRRASARLDAGIVASAADKQRTQTVGRHAHVEPCVFHGRADQQTPIIPRHEIRAGNPHDAPHESMGHR